MWDIARHHCSEGWPSDSENIAKHPLIARPGWFSDESKRKTTPAASASVASPNFLMTQPPLLAVVPCYVPHLLLDTGALKTTGGKAEVPSLHKEGWLRPLRKCRGASLAGADGVVGSSHRLSEVERTTPAAPSKEWDHLLDGAATPPLPRRGLRLSRRLSQTPVSSGRLVGNAQAVMQGGESRLIPIRSHLLRPSLTHQVGGVLFVFADVFDELRIRKQLEMHGH